MAIAYRAGATAINPTSTQDTASCNKPTGVVSGDVLLAHIFVALSGANLTGPAGWTRLLRVGSTDGAFEAEVWTLTAGGSEPGSYQWSGFGANNYRDIAIDAWSGVDNVAVVDVASAIQANTASGSPVSPSLTTVTNNAWVVVFMTGLNTTSLTVPASTNQRENYDGSNGVADFIQVTAGATGTSTWTNNPNTATTITSTVALRPAAATTSIPNKIYAYLQAVNRAATY